MNIEDLFSLLCTLVTEFWQDLDGGSEDRRRNIIHNATKLHLVAVFAFHDSSSLMLSAGVSVAAADNKQLVPAQPEG